MPDRLAISQVPATATRIRDRQDCATWASAVTKQCRITTRLPVTCAVNSRNLEPNHITMPATALSSGGKNFCSRKHPSGRMAKDAKCWTALRWQISLAKTPAICSQTIDKIWNDNANSSPELIVIAVMPSAIVHPGDPKSYSSVGKWTIGPAI